MIEVKNLGKVFKLYQTPRDRLKEIILRRCYHHTHIALEDINFTVKEGETLGIIGRNGTGKSTLLKLLMGVILPTSGEIKMEGRTTGLLELGTGFNPELTGIQNIYMNGVLLGMSNKELDEKKTTHYQFY